MARNPDRTGSRHGRGPAAGLTNAVLRAAVVLLLPAVATAQTGATQSSSQVPPPRAVADTSKPKAATTATPAPAKTPAPPAASAAKATAPSGGTAKPATSGTTAAQGAKTETKSAPAPAKSPAASGAVAKSPAAPGAVAKSPAVSAPSVKTPPAPAGTTPATTAAKPPAASAPGTAKPVAARPSAPPPPKSATATGSAPTTPAESQAPTSEVVRRIRTANPQKPVVPDASIEKRQTYQYNTIGRRDPFEAMVGNFVGEDVGGAAPFDIGAVKVVGIVWGADSFALVEDAAGNSGILRRGDKVMNGFVEDLKRDAMVVKITADGQSQSVAIPLTRKGDQSNANR